MSVLSDQQYRATVYSTGSNSERLFLEYKAFKANFQQDLLYLLEHYGLVERLNRAAVDPTAPKIRMLHVNCSEGLYMHGLAELLEAQNPAWISAVEFYGVDQDLSMIATALDYAALATPPRSYFQFYHHDYAQPFETILSVSSTKTDPSLLSKAAQAPAAGGFDLIFFRIGSGSLTAGTRSLLQRLYTHNLNPGGVIYLREFLDEEGPKGWIPPHPVMRDYLALAIEILKTFNGGEWITSHIVDWLEAVGASRIQTRLETLPHGGPTEEGRNFLRDMILSARVACPQFIELGLYTQAQYDHMMNTLFAELTPQHEGQITYLSVFAQKA